MDISHLTQLLQTDARYAVTLLIAVDVVAFWLGRDKNTSRRGYNLEDTVANFVIRLINLIIGPVTSVLTGAALVFAAAHLTPLHWTPHGVWAWLLIVLLADLGYYFEHRTAHRVRLLWTTHSVHHSSEYFNLSTAGRLGLFGATDLLSQLWYVPMALVGIPVPAIFLAKAITIVYQIPLHTERLDKAWAPIEFLFNTPSHHRVHHGSNNPYLDKNFGGILIIWDRMFGTYALELERVEFGLTHSIETHNPVKAYTFEIRSLVRDLRTAARWRDRAGYLFGPPGWMPGDRRIPETSGSAVANR